MERIQQFASLVICLTALLSLLSLLADASVLRYPVIEPVNELLDARSLSSSSSHSLSKRVLTYDNAVIKGNGLFCRLSHPALLEDQSPVTTTDMVEASGWQSTSERASNYILTNLKLAFDKWKIINDPADCINVDWRHLKASKNAQGQDVPPTKARYNNIYNAKAGFIIGKFNVSPFWELHNKPADQKIYPDVKSWSDIAFIDYQTQAKKTGQDVAGLNYIFQWQVINDDTKAIIQQVAGKKKGLNWPGITVNMVNRDGSPNPRGMAILGTPNIAGTAFLLGTHKAQFGQRTVEAAQWWVLDAGPEPELKYLIGLIKLAPLPATPPPATDMFDFVLEANSTYLI